VVDIHKKNEGPVHGWRLPLGKKNKRTIKIKDQGIDEFREGELKERRESKARGGEQKYVCPSNKLRSAIKGTK